MLSASVREVERGRDSGRAIALLMQVCVSKFVLQRQISAILKPARVEDLHAKVYESQRERERQRERLNVDQRQSCQLKMQKQTAYVSDGNCDFDVDVGVNVDVILPAYPPSNRLT